MAFFERHPKLSNAVHWFSALVGFLLVAPQAEIEQIVAHLPGSVATHKYVGYVLGILALSRFLALRVKAPDPAAPTVPASEAVTKLEKPTSEKK